MNSQKLPKTPIIVVVEVAKGGHLTLANSPTNNPTKCPSPPPPKKKENLHSRGKKYATGCLSHQTTSLKPWVAIKKRVGSFISGCMTKVSLKPLTGGAEDAGVDVDDDPSGPILTWPETRRRKEHEPRPSGLMGCASYD